jgi:carbonyl reductase 1
LLFSHRQGFKTLSIRSLSCSCHRQLAVTVLDFWSVSSLALSLIQYNTELLLLALLHCHSYKPQFIERKIMASRKVAIVTGSNKGIGFTVAKELCKTFDGTVYITARDEARGRAAVAELEKLGLKPAFHQLDIDSLDSIKAFRKYLEATHGGIDVLVNNAAMAYNQDATEPFGEQAENTVRVNFLGTLNVCMELFPLLRKHTRVVHVSSSAGHLVRICGQEPAASELKKRFSSPEATEEEIVELAKEFVSLAKEDKHQAAGWPNSAYAVSKVTLSALVPIQQRAFDKQRPDDDIVVNSCHPGYVDTDMSSHKGPLTVEEGAVAPLYLALLPPNVDKPRGEFVWRDKTVVDWANGELPAQY